MLYGGAIISYLGYIALMLILWTILRFIVSSILDLIKHYTEDNAKVQPFLNGVKYAVSFIVSIYD